MFFITTGEELYNCSSATLLIRRVFTKWRFYEMCSRYIRALRNFCTRAPTWLGSADTAKRISKDSWCPWLETSCGGSREQEFAAQSKKCSADDACAHVRIPQNNKESCKNNRVFSYTIIDTYTRASYSHE